MSIDKYEEFKSNYQFRGRGFIQIDPKKDGDAACNRLEECCRRSHSDRSRRLQCVVYVCVDSCCRFENRTARSLGKLEEQSEVGVKDLSDIQDEHHDDDTL